MSPRLTAWSIYYLYVNLSLVGVREAANYSTTKIYIII